MKTGTITFHAPNNNGSFLQAYALQNVLESQLHIDNEIIDFYSEQQARQYSVFRKPHSAGDIGRNLVSLLHYKGLEKRHQRFDDIRKKYLKLTKRCTVSDEVYDVVSKYDTVICGSDQIWNTEARDYSDVYFMTGTKKRKISYAASFGSHVESINKQKVKNNISDFSSIAVREEAGKNLLNDVLPEKEVSFVCDPTLLLDKSFYDKLISTSYNIKEPYIFLYTINYNEEILNVAQELSQKLKMPVYAAFTGYSCVKCKKYGIKVLYDVAPSEFLWLVEHATYTCSNSFHGIVFSIIFEKQFCRPTKVDESGNFVKDDRIDGILTQVGLDDRIVTNDGKCVDIIKQPINYKMAKPKLDKIRKNAIEYLKIALLG